MSIITNVENIGLKIKESYDVIRAGGGYYRTN